MIAESIAPPVLVQTADEFVKMVANLGAQERIAVDTESNSLHAYRERVCLVQFSTAQTDYILDPFAIPDLAALAPLFADPRHEKIFHACEYDILCLRRDYGFEFANLFDTMQAGRILGRRLAGLDRLLEDKLGLKVSKRFQKADWAVRPLSPSLLDYARMDTHYLPVLRDILKGELEAKGLWPLAEEDFRMACRPNGSKAKVESNLWTRFSGRRDLTLRELTILNELVAFREQMAAQLDRPPFKVLDDDHLIAVARAKPAAREDLREIGLTGRQIQSWGESLLSAVVRGMESPPVKRTSPQRPDDRYLRQLEQLKKWRKAAAAEMDVESDVVLPRPLLLALAEQGRPNVEKVMSCSPWRLEHFGRQIEKVLAGPEQANL